MIKWQSDNQGEVVKSSLLFPVNEVFAKNNFMHTVSATDNLRFFGYYLALRGVTSLLLWDKDALRWLKANTAGDEVHFISGVVRGKQLKITKTATE